MQNKNVGVRVIFMNEAKQLHGVVVAEWQGSLTILCDEDGLYYTKGINEVEDLRERDVADEDSEEIKICLEALDLIIRVSKKGSIDMAQIKEILADTRLKLLGKDDFITKP